MPYIPYAPTRYAPRYSQLPFAVSPGLLSPDAGDPSSPAFDPSMAQMDQNQQPIPLPPPPPQQPAPQSLNDTAASAQIANPPPLVPLNGQVPAGGSPKDTGVKQLLAANGKAAMPPPTPPVQASAAPAATPDTAATPDAGTFYPQALHAGGTAQESQPAAANATAFDPAIANLEQQRAKEEAKWNGNEAPKSNWLQRLSSALLALTRFAPYSNQIIHPKWTQEAERHEGVLSDITQQEQAINQANLTQATVLQREGVAEQRAGQAANYANAEADRQSKLAQASKDAQSKQWQQQLADWTKGREQDVDYMPSNDPSIPQLRDSGYHIVDNVMTPGQVIAIPPSHIQIPAAMVPFMPGHQAGDLVRWSEYKTAQANAIKQQQELAKPGPKPVPITNEYEGLVQQHTDANGNVDWKAVNDENDKRQIARAQAGKAQINTPAAPMSPTQAEAANAPVAPGEKREAFLSSLPSDQQTVIKALTNYTYPKLSAQSLRPAGNGQKGYYQDMLEKAYAYDPTFDYKQYDSRQKLLNDFTSGKSAQNIRSLNMLTGHLGALYQMGQALNNKNQNTYNRLALALSSEFGDPRLTDFNLAKAAVATELSSALKGQATEGDINTWANNIKSSGSPQQLIDTVRVPLGLMHTRMQELQNQYTQGMGKPFKWPSEQAMDAFRAAHLDPLSVDPLGYVRTGTLNGRRIGAKADGTVWDLNTHQQVKQ